MRMLMSKLQSQNPQMFQMLNNAMRSGQNPNQLISQVMKNATPEQKQSVFEQAKQYGVPDEVLKEIQNG